MRARLCILLALAPLTLHAQQGSPASSTISGKVFCADTNAPGRFAKVLFKPVGPAKANPFLSNLQKTMEQVQSAEAKSGETPPPTPAEAAEKSRQLAAASRGMSAMTDILSATTAGLNGDYSLSALKPGTYYIHASLPGYIDPLTQFTEEELASTDPQVHARVAAAVPIITVSGTDAVHLDLRLERGASVSGRVLYDDGTPASGWTISIIQPVTGDAGEDSVDAAMSTALAMIGQSSRTARSDDLGNFRIAGLPAGSYALRAGIVATPTGVSASNARDGGSGINLAVYSGDTFSRAAAKSFTLTAGDVRSGSDITIPQHRLHNISGHVSARTDAHSLNGGNMMLTSKDDPSLHLIAAIHADGGFSFEDVPSGSYTVLTADAADTRTTGSSKLLGISIPKTETLHRYAPGSSNVMLADVDLTGIDFSLAQLNWQPPAGKAGDDDEAAAAKFGKAFGALLAGDDSSDDKDDSSKDAKPSATSKPTTQH